MRITAYSIGHNQSADRSLPERLYAYGPAGPWKGSISVKSFREKYLTNIWNIPNLLTMLRLALIPVFIVLHIAGHAKLSLLVFCIASATDCLDGYIARRYQLVTDFGKLMDPLADKLMVCAALVMQGIANVFPIPAVIIVIIKEALMVYGSSYMLHNGIVVCSNLWGKLAQFSFICALVLSFWHDDFTAFPVDQIILWIAVVIAIIALIDYTQASLKTLREVRAQNPA